MLPAKRGCSATHKDKQPRTAFFRAIQIFC